MLIPLGHGQFTEVDDQDFSKVFGLSFRRIKGRHTYYAYCDRKGYLHRLLLGITDKEIQIDHIDGNGLNNRRDNLRIATNTQNQHNREAKHQYKGVDYLPEKNKWMARITVEGKQLYIGIFDTPEQAAEAYNKRAIHHFGEFAKLNEVKR